MKSKEAEAVEAAWAMFRNTTMTVASQFKNPYDIAKAAFVAGYHVCYDAQQSATPSQPSCVQDARDAIVNELIEAVKEARESAAEGYGTDWQRIDAALDAAITAKPGKGETK